MTDPNAVFTALHHAAQSAAGARLFTVTVLDRKEGLARRAYTSHTDAYPATGTKPMRSDAWSDLVIGQHKSFVANDTPGFAIYFSDHALINALGCHSALNMPVVEGGQVIGTVNVLDVAGHFTPERVATLEGLVAAHHDALVAAIAATPMEG